MEPNYSEWQAHNEREVARPCGSADCLNTPDWVPSTDEVWINQRHPTWLKRWNGRINLGAGDKISCGDSVSHLHSEGPDEWRDTQRRNNVCRPFDSAHMISVAARGVGEPHSTTADWYREMEAMYRYIKEVEADLNGFFTPSFAS